MALFIQDTFIIVQNGISLSDAIILPKTEYEALSALSITALKQARFAAHKNRLENPPVIPQPKDEDVLADVVKQLEELTKQKTDLELKIDQKGK